MTEEYGGQKMPVMAHVGSAYLIATAAYPVSTTVSDGTPTIFPFTAPAKNVVSTGAPNYRYVIKKGGLYRIDASLVFAGNATGARGVLIYVNGAEVIRGYFNNAGAGSAVSPIASYVKEFTAGDYIQVFYSQSSTGNLNVTAGQFAVVPQNYQMVVNSLRSD